MSTQIYNGKFIVNVFLKGTSQGDSCCNDYYDENIDVEIIGCYIRIDWGLMITEQHFLTLQLRAW